MSDKNKIPAWECWGPGWHLGWYRNVDVKELVEANQTKPSIGELMGDELEFDVPEFYVGIVVRDGRELVQMRVPCSGMSPRAAHYLAKVLDLTAEQIEGNMVKIEPSEPVNE